MNSIDRAADALVVSLYGEDCGNTSAVPDRNRLREAVHAVLVSLHDPSDGMTQAGAEIIRNVGSAESSEAHLSDAANTWRFMIDALLAE